MTSGAAASIAYKANPDAFDSFAGVRRLMHRTDESHLWPIKGRFNGTTRAVRRVNQAMRDGLVIDTPLEYYAAIDAELSRIVNDPNL